jgi:hypothetical protein
MVEVCAVSGTDPSRENNLKPSIKHLHFLFERKSWPNKPFRGMRVILSNRTHDLQGRLRSIGTSSALYNFTHVGISHSIESLVSDEQIQS